MVIKDAKKEASVKSKIKNKGICLLSWKCPSHVLAMSSGWGHVQKSQGQNQKAIHFLSIICSVTCLQRVLTVSHMSSLPPVAKKTCKSTKSSKSIFGRLVQFLCLFIIVSALVITTSLSPMEQKQIFSISL